MAIDRGLVRVGATVQRDSDGMKATILGITNGIVQLRPYHPSPPVHRRLHSVRPKTSHGPAYAHTTPLTVPLPEFLVMWSSPGLKVCKHPGIVSKTPTRCPYCAAMVYP